MDFLLRCQNLSLIVVFYYIYICFLILKNIYCHQAGPDFFSPSQHLERSPLLSLPLSQVTISTFLKAWIFYQILVSANPSPGHQAVPSNDPENPSLLHAAATDIVKPPVVMPESLEYEHCQADTIPLSEAAQDFNDNTKQSSL